LSCLVASSFGADACECVACSCDGDNTCPRSIAAGGNLVFAYDCGTYCTGSYSVSSSDSSKFQSYAMSSIQYRQYQKDPTHFGFDPNLSTTGPVTCFTPNSGTITTDYMFIVIECTNSLLSCGISYDTEFFAYTSSTGSGNGMIACSECDNVCDQKCETECSGHGGVSHYSCNNNNEGVQVTCTCGNPNLANSLSPIISLIIFSLFAGTLIAL